MVQVIDIPFSAFSDVILFNKQSHHPEGSKDKNPIANNCCNRIHFLVYFLLFPLTPVISFSHVARIVCAAYTGFFVLLIAIGLNKTNYPL